METSHGIVGINGSGAFSDPAFERVKESGEGAHLVLDGLDGVQ